MLTTINLTKGQVAIVDAADYEWLSTYKWCYQSPGYASTRRNDQLILMHRLILPPPVGIQIDHINRDRLDNRRCNLRYATPSQQNQNHGIRSGNKQSAYKGVGWHGQHGKWRARIKLHGKDMYLGLFSDEISAARAYDAAAILHFGEFAWLNFPEGYDHANND